MAITEPGSPNIDLAPGRSTVDIFPVEYALLAKSYWFMNRYGIILDFTKESDDMITDCLLLPYYGEEYPHFKMLRRQRESEGMHSGAKIRFYSVPISNSGARLFDMPSKPNEPPTTSADLQFVQNCVPEIAKALIEARDNRHPGKVERFGKFISKHTRQISIKPV